MWSVNKFNSESHSLAAGGLKSLIDNNMIITYCCVGISHLGRETLTQKIINYLDDKKYIHTSIWISDKMPEEDNQLGIVVEYGDYSQGLECKLQIDDQGNESWINIEKDNVKYPYEDRGGLRYYLLSFEEFTEKLGSVAYAELSVKQENQINIKDFMNKCFPLSNDQWNKEKYNYKNHNCQHFSAYLLDKLKPKYEPKCIIIKHKSYKERKKREDVFPAPILDVLKALK